VRPAHGTEAEALSQTRSLTRAREMDPECLAPLDATRILLMGFYLGDFQPDSDSL